MRLQDAPEVEMKPSSHDPVCATDKTCVGPPTRWRPQTGLMEAYRPPVEESSGRPGHMGKQDNPRDRARRGNTATAGRRACGREKEQGRHGLVLEAGGILETVAEQPRIPQMVLAAA